MGRGRVVQPAAGGAANELSRAGLWRRPRSRHVSGECGGRLAAPPSCSRRSPGHGPQGPGAARRRPVGSGREQAAAGGGSCTRPRGVGLLGSGDGCRRGGGVRVRQACRPGAPMTGAGGAVERASGTLPPLVRRWGCRRGGGVRVWHACRPWCAGGGCQGAVGCASGARAAWVPVTVPKGRWGARPARMPPLLRRWGCQTGGGLRVWRVLPRVRRSDGCRRDGGAHIWHRLFHVKRPEACRDPALPTGRHRPGHGPWFPWGNGPGDQPTAGMSGHRPDAAPVDEHPGSGGPVPSR